MEANQFDVLPTAAEAFTKLGIPHDLRAIESADDRFTFINGAQEVSSFVTQAREIPIFRECDGQQLPFAINTAPALGDLLMADKAVH